MKKLNNTNNKLTKELNMMKEFCKLIQKSKSVGLGGGTCLAVLLLSFALFMIPSGPPGPAGPSSHLDGVKTGGVETTFRTRTLLSLPTGVQDEEFGDASLRLLKSLPLVNRQIEKIADVFEQNGDVVSGDVADINDVVFRRGKTVEADVESFRATLTFGASNVSQNFVENYSR